MLTTTQHSILPTTVTGSWPRPRWFNQSLWGRRLSDAMTDIHYREKFLDAAEPPLQIDNIAREHSELKLPQGT